MARIFRENLTEKGKLRMDAETNRPRGTTSAFPHHDAAAWAERPECWDERWLQFPFLKRSIDVVGAVCGLIVLAPLLILIALSVKATSQGPIFYRGVRTGRFAQPFRIFKFRTMVRNAERLGGTTTAQNDARVTKVGAWLRRYKLDELPQLINVLFGDISLVGPRPEVYEYTTKFNERQQVILAVRPGITDLSSLHFINLQSHLGDGDADEVFRNKILPVKNRLRVKYVLEHSIAGDLNILLQTVKRLVSPRSESQVDSGVPPIVTRLKEFQQATVTLGHSPFRISRVAMGCWATGGHGWGNVNDLQSMTAIRTAWEQGINHFDTADVYGLGHSETLLSKALGPDRHDAVIASKFGVRVDADGRSHKDLSPDYCQQAVEASLRRLRIESIPLYYAHWPDQRTSMESLMNSMLRLREEGKIQSIGLSNFSAAQVREAIAYGPVDALQVQYSLIEPSGWLELAAVCQEFQITAITWGSLGRGLLTGKFHPNSNFDHDDSRSRDPQFQGSKFLHNLETAALVKRVAQQRDVPPGQVALRYALDTPGIGCSLFGAKTSEQVLENVGTLAWKLDPQAYQLLNSRLNAPHKPDGLPLHPTGRVA